MKKRIGSLFFTIAILLAGCGDTEENHHSNPEKSAPSGPFVSQVLKEEFFHFLQQNMNHADFDTEKVNPEMLETEFQEIEDAFLVTHEVEEKLEAGKGTITPGDFQGLLERFQKAQLPMPVIGQTFVDMERSGDLNEVQLEMAYRVISYFLNSATQ